MRVVWGLCLHAALLRDGQQGFHGVKLKGGPWGCGYCASEECVKGQWHREASPAVLQPMCPSRDSLEA